MYTVSYNMMMHSTKLSIHFAQHSSLKDNYIGAYLFRPEVLHLLCSDVGHLEEAVVASRPHPLDNHLTHLHHVFKRIQRRNGSCKCKSTKTDTPELLLHCDRNYQVIGKH